MSEKLSLTKLIENAVNSATTLAQTAGNEERQISGESRLQLANAAAVLLEVAAKARVLRASHGDDLTR